MTSSDSPPTDRPSRWLPRLSARRALLASLLLLALIAALDYQVSGEITFTAFYMLPVSLATWFAGRRWGLAIAALAIIVALAANTASGLHYSQPAIYVWDSLMELGPLVLVAGLLTRVRDVLAHEQRLARTDYLTEVYNRRAFYELLQADLARTARYQRPLTVAYFDLDNFKAVNDQYGHAVGDIVLRTVAATARHSLRATDIVARLGGDEFGLLLPETAPDAARTALDNLSRRLRADMAEQHWPVTFSIGMLVITGPAASVDAVLGAADDLMYRVKRAGKNALLVGEYPPPQPAAPAVSEVSARI
jgi:diguanylate cyclase (GGDEF)-like protein